MHMKEKVKKLLQNKDKTVPILSFPSTRLLGISVNELISSADRQVEGMVAIAQRTNIGASLNMMDLSVEAEAFGAKIRFSDDEVPTVEKGILDPTKVSRSALQNAASVASVMLTTECLVADIPAPEPAAPAAPGGGMGGMY